MKRILIAGATSAIAEAYARRCAGRGDAVFLLARNSERLAELTQDLGVRGAARVVARVFDANVFTTHAEAIDAAIANLGGLDVALVAWGTLGDQGRAQVDADYMLAEFNTNAVSAIHFMTILGDRMRAARAGTIAYIGSVAGDRGRQSNYVYGAAKGAVALFAQGLRNRLFRDGVHVLTIKPGFVDTPMTKALAKGPLWSSPEAVAAGIERAIDKRRNVAYLPFWWSLMMFVVRLIPERIFVRLSL